MANDDPQPQFLGGGPKFNQAGSEPKTEEIADITPAPPPYQARARIIIIALLLLIGLLYAVMVGPNGLTVIQGHGGISPEQHTTGPANGNVP